MLIKMPSIGLKITPTVFTILWASTICVLNRNNIDWVLFATAFTYFTLLGTPSLFYQVILGRFAECTYIKVVCWVSVYCVYPMVSLLSNLLLFSDSINQLFFVVLLVVNSICLFPQLFRFSSKIRSFYFKNALDYSLFSFTIAFSLFWALVLSAEVNQDLQQPFIVTLDYKSVLNSPLLFVSLFIQLQVIHSAVFFIYFIHRHFCIRRILDKYGFVHYFFITASLLLLLTPLLNQIVLFLPINNHEQTLIFSGDKNPFDSQNYFFALAVIVVSLPIILAFEWTRKKQQVSELSKVALQAELNFLHQQINPHFLFNTLNNVYSLCTVGSSRAADMVYQLSNLLRFSVYKGGKDTVSINEEVEYLQDYIELQRIRVKERCEINFISEVDNENIKIAPLMLIVLLENAFKHGVDCSNNRSWINIKLSVSNGELSFKCCNSIPDEYEQKQYQSIEGTSKGIGLKNLKRRLALLYNDSYQLTLQRNEQTFNAELTLGHK